MKYPKNNKQKMRKCCQQLYSKNLQFKWNGQTHWQIQLIKIDIIWNRKSS